MFGVLTVVCALVASAQTELPDYSDLTLIGQANAALTGIREINFFNPGPAVTTENEQWVRDTAGTSGSISRTCVAKLEKTGLKVHNHGSLIRPELVVHTELLYLPDSQALAFYVQSSFSRILALPDRSQTKVGAVVWTSAPIMHVVSTEDMSEKISEAVLHQIEAFAVQWSAANNSDAKAPDANEIKPQSRRAATSRKAPGQDTVEASFVASKNSKVFHKPDCSSARRILPENLVPYKTRDEAINAGKRPCKRCKP